MKIGIDASTWSNHRGFGRFTRSLVTAMTAEFPQHEFVFIADEPTVRESVFPPTARIEIVRTEDQQTKAASAAGSRRVSDLFRMGRAVERVSPDVFFFPTHYAYFPLHSRIPAVVVLHDASSENRPELFFPNLLPRTLWRLKSRMALWQATRVVTVSENARHNISRAFGYDETKIDVVSEGPDAAFQHLEKSDANASRARTVFARYSLPTQLPTLLYVGGISPHKNIATLLRALATEPLRNSAWHLALVGNFSTDVFLGNHNELVGLAQTLGLSDRITFTGFVPDDDLVVLYNAATLFVMPSFTEGFGLPVLEAMTCGLPVLASDRSALPEVLGGAGLLFDPDSPSALAELIVSTLADNRLRAALTARGLEQSKRYTWTSGAHGMMKILEQAANTRRT